MPPETERMLETELRAYRKNRRIAGLFYLVLWFALVSISLVIIGCNTGLITL